MPLSTLSLPSETNDLLKALPSESSSDSVTLKTDLSYITSSSSDCIGTTSTFCETTHSLRGAEEAASGTSADSSFFLQTAQKTMLTYLKESTTIPATVSTEVARTTVGSPVQNISKKPLPTSEIVYIKPFIKPQSKDITHQINKMATAKSVTVIPTKVESGIVSTTPASRIIYITLLPYPIKQLTSASLPAGK